MDLVQYLERTGRKIDSKVPGPVYEVGRRLYYSYAQNPVLNWVRRRRDYCVLWIDSRLGDPPRALHLGCGLNDTEMCDVDVIKTRATDFVLDARNLPLPTDSVERIETYHMVEHIPRNSLSKMFTEWRRVLKPGGTLVIEVPDFDAVVSDYLSAEDPEYTDTLLRYVFGSQRFESDIHYWGWNERRLRETLHEHGFEAIEREPPTDYHAEEAPCMRIEATKPET